MCACIYVYSNNTIRTYKHTHTPHTKGEGSLIAIWGGGMPDQSNTKAQNTCEFCTNTLTMMNRKPAFGWINTRNVSLLILIVALLHTKKFLDRVIIFFFKIK